MTVLISADERAGWDPLFATFHSLTIGQLALVVLAVFLVTGEYSTGTIRTSITAIPRRGLFYAAKVPPVRCWPRRSPS